MRVLAAESVWALVLLTGGDTGPRLSTILPGSDASSSPRFAGSPRSTPLHPYTNSRAQQQAASIFAPRLLATPRSDIAATSWLQGRSWPPAGTGRDETRRALQRKPRPEF